MPTYSIEEIILQAMKEGKFDDLPGKGKPLNLDQNPHQDPEWRVAHHFLNSAGFTLPWIELLVEISDNLKHARETLTRTCVWHTRTPENKLDHVEWQTSLDLFEERVKSINDQIRTYNLEVPNPVFQAPLVDFEKELERIINNEDS